MMGYIIMTIFMLGGLMTIYMIGRGIRIMFLFRWDRNPYRRFCRKCGQCQESYTFWIEGYTHSWYEDMCPVPDESCACHNYSEYRSLI